ncbi:MAG TPA: hypothetical protein VFT65_01300 [Candidatus Angelobacter sp.]|nr:hypothetical protein [Candidatus Angelobacter sp.]
MISLAALCAVWYSVSLRFKQRKARQVLRWIQSSLAGRGQVVGISWIDASKFRVPLRLSSGVFQRAWVLVEVESYATPVQWLLNKLKKKRETLTFQADLDCPPAFSLHLNNFRWFARSSRRTPVNRPGWRFEHLPALVITTQKTQQAEITAAMASLSKPESREFLNVSFQRRSPHFSATLPLESLAPGSPAQSYVLDAMRELAGSASTSLS